jgi:hypothetical protein
VEDDEAPEIRLARVLDHALLETWTKARITRLFEQIDDLEARADRLIRRSASASTWSDSIH